jgi:hypothetical protein
MTPPPLITPQRGCVQVGNLGFYFRRGRMYEEVQKEVNSVERTTITKSESILSVIANVTRGAQGVYSTEITAGGDRKKLLRENGCVWHSLVDGCVATGGQTKRERERCYKSTWYLEALRSIELNFHLRGMPAPVGSCRCTSLPLQW